MASIEKEDKDLLYALRAMDVLLGAGIGLESVLINIGRGGYGAISKDFAAMIDEVKKGNKLEEQFQRSARKTKSVGYKRLLETMRANVTSNTDLIEALRRQADREEDERNQRLEKYIETLAGMPETLLTVGMLAPIILPLLGVLPYLFDPNAMAAIGVSVPTASTMNMISAAGLSFSVALMALVGMKAHTQDPGL
jgi:pilus assembly protein TadC